jgi:hypothetical protein
MSHIADFGSSLSCTCTWHTQHPSHMTKNFRVLTCLLEAQSFAENTIINTVIAAWSPVKINMREKEPNQGIWLASLMQRWNSSLNSPKPKRHDKFVIHTTPQYVYQTDFKNLTKFVLFFTHFLPSESPSVSFGVTWPLMFLCLALWLSGSVDLLIDLVPAAICLPSGPVSTCLVLVPWIP